MIDWYVLSLLLHIVALAGWLGGIVFFLVVFGPAANELQPGIGLRALNHGRMSFEMVSWAAIALLLLTGIINLVLLNQTTGAHQGELYTIVLAVKLFLFLAMLIHHCLQVFKYAPRIAAATLEAPPESTSWPEPLRALWQKWFVLLKITATLGPIVILLGLILVKG